jgi:hypothetical protein
MARYLPYTKAWHATYLTPKHCRYSVHRTYNGVKIWYTRSGFAEYLSNVGFDTVWAGKYLPLYHAIQRYGLMYLLALRGVA